VVVPISLNGGWQAHHHQDQDGRGDQEKRTQPCHFLNIHRETLFFFSLFGFLEAVSRALSSLSLSMGAVGDDRSVGWWCICYNELKVSLFFSLHEVKTPAKGLAS